MLFFADPRPAHPKRALRQAYALLFLAAVALDIGAHWAQMYASLLSRAASHKDVSAATSPLLRLYYSSRPFMGSLCVGAEVFYMVRARNAVLTSSRFRNHCRAPDALCHTR